MVMAGKDVGLTGTIQKVIRSQNRVIVEGRNLVKKHLKRTEQNPGNCGNGGTSACLKCTAGGSCEWSTRQSYIPVLGGWHKGPGIHRRKCIWEHYSSPCNSERETKTTIIGSGYQGHTKGDCFGEDTGSICRETWITSALPMSR
jgi:hypothetical protein